MPWRVTSSDVEVFRQELWKDERVFVQGDDAKQFVKDCFDSESAGREMRVLEMLENAGGERLSPSPLRISGQYLTMSAVPGMRLFELLRALRQIELRRRDGVADHARSVLMSRQRQRLQRIQEVLLENTPELAPEPYPLGPKVLTLLELLCRVLGIQMNTASRVNLDELSSYWLESCGNIPFRDATPKNTIVSHPDLARANRLTGVDADVGVVAQMVDRATSEMWHQVEIRDVDFTSVEHLTTYEDDPISLHFHEWTNGTCSLDPRALILLPSGPEPDPYRAAATFVVRYLRFGGRKLAYRLINSQGFEIRFRYDDPLFYFRSLGGIVGSLSPEFLAAHAALLDLIHEIGRVAANPSPSDRQLLGVDHFRKLYGHGGDYYGETPVRERLPSESGDA